MLFMFHNQHYINCDKNCHVIRNMYRTDLRVDLPKSAPPTRHSRPSPSQ